MYAAILPRQRLVLVGLALSLLSVFLLYSLFGRSLSSFHTALQANPDAIAAREANLHLIIPTTKSEFYFCQLLFSATVLGWPHPTLIGWGLQPKEGDPDGKVSHIFKVSRTLEYFNSLPADQDDDLVLLIDAYDVWFQLRPDVLIQRYYSMRDAANQRLISELGPSIVAKHGLRQTIFFNADKTLWPSMDTSTFLWWLPNSTLPEYAFGPETDKGDHWMDRPRWLNSGAIIGPLGDMRRLFNATLNKINLEFNETVFQHSDQLYLSEIWSNQEYARMLLGPNRSLVEEHSQDMALLASDQETEYHISLDYKSELFLANAFYEDFLAWMTFPTPKKQPSHQIMLAPYQIDLSEDILSSPHPFSVISSALDNDEAYLDSSVDSLVANTSWRDIELGTNLITNQVFPLIHMTGNKDYRDTWWERMWYFPYSRALLTAAAIASPDDFITRTSADGRIWRAANRPPNATEKSPNDTIGAWSAEGKWLPWHGPDGLCEIYEDYLFGQLAPPPPENLGVTTRRETKLPFSQDHTSTTQESLVVTVDQQQRPPHTQTAKTPSSNETSKPKPVPTSTSSPNAPDHTQASKPQKT
ncbi:hypothetical protein EV356DRAFT_563600 [Viridothelium virens]|uniref:Uncharacterized protein n=1 Tax=Viridothelium virens TaxID=1048519 RepID=A0A6A6HLL8_VIRVR|nr:hypothetical protein EV356DRAFT_563600 [Viridothelium virens]